MDLGMKVLRELTREVTLLCVQAVVTTKSSVVPGVVVRFQEIQTLRKELVNGSLDITVALAEELSGLVAGSYPACELKEVVDELIVDGHRER